MSYFLIINVLAFFLCMIDKKNAIKQQARIPEKVLLGISLIGGSFGMTIGMHLFHHKTKKLKFKLVYIFDIIWLFIYYTEII